MKEISFLSGLLIALGMSLAVKLLCPLVALFCGGAAAVQFTIAACVVSYLWILTALSPRKSGRLVCAVSLPVVECGLLLVPLQPLSFLLLSVVLVWVGRSVLLARGTLDVLVEGSLVAVAAMSMALAFMATGGLGLLTWSFFLVLAGRPMIQTSRRQTTGAGHDPSSRSDSVSSFEDSHAAAQRALARLAR